MVHFKSDTFIFKFTSGKKTCQIFQPNEFNDCESDPPNKPSQNSHFIDGPNKIQMFCLYIKENTTDEFKRAVVLIVM
jgi:hypothetical protein